MSKITCQDVEHVANLAYLDLNEDEKKEFTNQLDSILEYVDKINELNTSNILPTSHPIPLTNVMREDRVKGSLPVEDVLINAPESEKEHFRVPRII